MGTLGQAGVSFLLGRESVSLALVYGILVAVNVGAHAPIPAQVAVEAPRAHQHLCERSERSRLESPRLALDHALFQFVQVE